MRETRAASTNSPLRSTMRPTGSTKPLMPVLAARTRARLFSTARNTAMAMDWCGALDRPYQASLVRLTSRLAPRVTLCRAISGKIDS